ncbi:MULTISPECIES: CHAD domain-containing protein [Tabrizicola]|uniref:CHAD domain-containing protein n=1 Tax=Tabrizicola TaxID=1443919 RepID=UPI001082030C|nr:MULTISPECIES: CHAD domain-containing protein [Paracoccaceae]
MAYAFHRDDRSPDHSLRRIATEELSTALNRFEAVPAPEAIHGIRKNLKKTRALLRLFRSALPEQPAANAVLREVAAALSARRDAAVRLATFDRLFPEPPEALQPLRIRLVADSLAPAQDIPHGLSERLSDLRDQAATWRLQGKPHRALKDGLARTRRKARQACDAARKAPERADLVHEWRKRVKDLWYQTRLVVPVWPDLFRVLTAEADALGEALGNHNDLAILANHLAVLPEDLLPGPARDLVQAQIDQARSDILARAFPASDRLLAGDPEAMADTWVAWLKLWHRSR